MQPYSGSPANFAVYTGLLKPFDKILGMSLPAGGHLTHGHYVSASGIFFSSVMYSLNPATGLIDYDQVDVLARAAKPKLIIAGGSAYPRDYDYVRFRAIADEVGAILMMDMAHTAGLIAAGKLTSPFKYADIVTTTTHKTLRGPRGALIFFKKQYEKQIHMGVFPGCQGGPHNHIIAGIATNFKQVMSEEYKQYA